MNYVYNLIDLCKRFDIQYHHQSVVVLESKPVDTESNSTSQHFFDINKVLHILAIERPHDRGQLYIADGLSSRYHFSCPTHFLPSLIKAIQQSNNKELNLLFIPRSTYIFRSDRISVINNVPIPDIFQDDESAKSIYHEVLQAGEKVGGDSLAASGKRCNHSFSMGLQTMYAHQQHSARYSMLSHSMPHVPDVKNVPQILMQSILSVYLYVLKVLDDRLDHKLHPLRINETNLTTEVEVMERLKLRNDFINHFKHKCPNSNVTLLSNETMFEACTVQPTSALGFHQDLMNCPSMDKTIAYIVPTGIEYDVSSKNDKQHSLSYLFYSRKCVGDHSKKLSAMKTYDIDPDKCKLTKLCLRSIMHVGGIFDYQGSLFEGKESMTTIALQLENHPDHCCPNIKEFTGLTCFKHGAAFDKMGYYSIFVNVFLCFYYKNIIINTDDAVSLCMYFGLLCNGTSSLAAVWNSIYKNTEAVKRWLGKRHHPTKLFECLYKLYGKRVGANKAERTVLYGNSMLPRYQYANHASMIIDSANEIYRIVIDFMTWRTSGGGKNKRVTAQHDYLYNKLKKIKGVGPMSFNQFWHSMCLCGIVPHGHIQCSTVGPTSGPAKLIQTFYPYVKSADAQRTKLCTVRKELNTLGFHKITEFFIENMMCELWRIVSRVRVFKKGMTTEDKVDALLSEMFQCHIATAAPTKHPDIYFCNPFTGEQQHLFRVIDKELLMRPSFMDNKVTGSVNMQCSIQCNHTDGKIKVKWSGDILRSLDKEMYELFA